MNTLKNVGKRVVALVLALMMCVGMLSTTAFAAKETHSNDKYCTLCASGKHNWGPSVSHYHPEWEISVTSRICKCCNAEDVYHAACVVHKYEAVVTPPTCTKDGYTTYTCNKVNLGKVCGASYTTAYVKATGVHTQDSGTVTTAATCLHKGEKTFKCTGCDMVMSTEPIALDANNHDAACHVESRGNNDTQHWNVLSCGVTTNYENHSFVRDECEVCGYKKTTDPVTPPEHEHIWGEVQVEHEATCTSNAIGKRDCTVPGCNASQDNVEVEGTMLGHRFTNKWIQQGTDHILQCDRCEATAGTSRENHTMGDWVVAVKASCTSEGKETRACTKCDYTESRAIAKTEHEYENGSCVNCGQPDPNAPCEHNNLVKIKDQAATCTLPALEVWECKDCHEFKQTVVLSQPLEHDFSVHVATSSKAATCTEKGVDVYKCSRCLETQVTELPMKAHTRVDHPEVPATCTETGIAAHWTCSDCGKLFVGPGTGASEVAAADLVIPIDRNNHTGETDVWTYVDDGAHGKFCTDCHKQYATGSHSFGDWAYNEAEQSWSRACADCGYTQTTTDASAIHHCDDYWSEDFQPSGNGHVHVCTFPGCGNVSNPPEAHEFGEWEVITAARPGVAGERAHTCGICGLTETDTIPALPDTGTGDVVIDDTNPPLGGDPDSGEVELDDGEIPLAGPVTRAEFVDYLYRHEGSPDTALSTFVDVPADHDYANAVGWGQANNIAWGISETEFAPDELVTVEQVKLFLSRYAAFKGSEMPELAALVGLDDQDPAMNCDEILGEFFGADE